jgi:hypothetical protein
VLAEMKVVSDLIGKNDEQVITKIGCRCSSQRIEGPIAIGNLDQSDVE